MKLKSFGFRLDEKKVKEARRLGIKIAALIRDAIDQEIEKRKGACRACGTRHE